MKDVWKLLSYTNAKAIQPFIKFVIILFIFNMGLLFFTTSDAAVYFGMVEKLNAITSRSYWVGALVLFILHIRRYRYKIDQACMNRVLLLPIKKDIFLQSELIFIAETILLLLLSIYASLLVYCLYYSSTLDIGLSLIFYNLLYGGYTFILFPRSLLWIVNMGLGIGFITLLYSTVALSLHASDVLITNVFVMIGSFIFVMASFGILYGQVKTLNITLIMSVILLVMNIGLYRYMNRLVHSGKIGG